MQAAFKWLKAMLKTAAMRINTDAAVILAGAAMSLVGQVQSSSSHVGWMASMG